MMLALLSACRGDELPQPTDLPADPLSATQDNGAEETPAAAEPGAHTGPLTVPFELGGQVLSDAFLPVDQLNQAGMTWVKYQVVWTPTADAAPVKDLIEQAHAFNYNVLISVTGERYPQSIDFSDYAQFVGQIATYGPDAIEVWNEPNLEREWPPGQIDPAMYVNNMLAPTYRLVKSLDPEIIVISGAPAPTGASSASVMPDDQYADGLVAAGASDYLDCVGVHFNSGTTSPSVRSGRMEGDHYSWYFLPTVEMYHQKFAQSEPICITELGYLSGEGLTGGLPPAFSWAEGTTVADQATWLAEAAQIGADSGWIRLMIVWNVNFNAQGDDPQAGYAIIRPDGSCPACVSLATATR